MPVTPVIDCSIDVGRFYKWFRGGMFELQERLQLRGTSELKGFVVERRTPEHDRQTVRLLVRDVSRKVRTHAGLAIS